jgi:hypothetical protein
MAMRPVGAERTADEVLEGVDLAWLTALVTGASRGLGVETARALAAHGAGLVLGVRDPAKGHRALPRPESTAVATTSGRSTSPISGRLGGSPTACSPTSTTSTSCSPTQG